MGERALEEQLPLEASAVLGIEHRQHLQQLVAVVSGTADGVQRSPASVAPWLPHLESSDGRSRLQ